MTDNGKQTRQTAVARTLIYIALPLGLGAFIVFANTFLPGRGRPPLLEFRPDLPIAIACEVMGATALALWIAAWVLMRRSR